MYVTIRTINAQLSRVQDAVGVVSYVVGQINANHGGTLGIALPVGGDPSVINVHGNWETLDQFAKARASWMADPEIASAMRMGAEMVTGMQDTIGQVIKPPGDPAAMAVTNTAMMNLTQVVDAIAFAVEVSEYAQGITGRESGVVTAVTGNRSAMFWVSYANDMAEVENQGQALETDADYLAFFKRSEGLFAPNTLEQSIWQLLT